MSGKHNPHRDPLDEEMRDRVDKAAMQVVLAVGSLQPGELRPAELRERRFKPVRRYGR